MQERSNQKREKLSKLAQFKLGITEDQMSVLKDR